MSALSTLRFCWRAAIRPRRSARVGLAPGILSIALGVCVFLAVAIANRGASESFRRAFEAVSGRADLEIRGTIDETVIPAVAGMHGIAATTPLVEATVTLPDYPGESLRLAGIDPFSGAGLLGFEPPAGNGGMAGGLEEWLARDDTLAVTPAFLNAHGLKLGSTLRLQGAGAPRTFRIATLVDSPAVPANVAAADIATVQEWTGRRGTISAILIRLDDPKGREAVTRSLRALLPQDLSVEPPAGRTGRVEAMIAAFRLNLTAMSLVALMVGVFFVGNAASASVVRQRVTLGILRAVGASRAQIVAVVLTEALVTGGIGSVLGWLASPLLAGIVASPLARTVSTLYLPVEARGGWPTIGETLLGIGAGIGAALVAALIPARQAARLDPVRVLHPGTAPEIFPVRIGSLAVTGVVLLGGALGFSIWVFGGGPAPLGFPAAFLVLAGGALLTPGAMRMAGGMIDRHASIMRLAIDQSLRSLHRTAPTAAALGAAAAMTVGIGVMIHSFRGSVIAWVDRTLAADLFIAPASNEALGLEHVLPEGAAAWWHARPEVATVGSFRELEARTPSGESVTLGLIEGPARGSMEFLKGNERAQRALLEKGGCTALTESLARRLGLSPGHDLVVVGPDGPIRLTILDLCRDYTRDRGIAMVGDAAFRRVWPVEGVHSLAITFRDGTPPAVRESVRGEFLRNFGGREAFACYENADLRRRILVIFEQTFAVTSILRTIAIAVAIGGVVLTLGILVMERARDLAVLRSVGASRWQIGGMILAEAGFLGVVASVIGLITGVGLALVLTYVINRAFFGWTIDLSFPWREMLMLPCWMVGTALLAGLVPAWRAMRIPPAMALRME